MVRWKLVWCCVSMVPAALCSAEVRTWTDKSGKHTVEAELERVVGGNATLKLATGKSITLPLEKFSDADRKILEASKRVRRVGGTPVKTIVSGGSSRGAINSATLNFGTKFSELRRMAMVQRDAAFVLTLYLAFLESDAVDDAEKEKARGELDKWREMADAEKIRVGHKWMTAEEREQAEKAEIRLIKEAHRAIDIKDDRVARDKFLEASKLNPEGVRADFYLGLLNALVAHHHYEGDEHFGVCVARLKRDDDILYGARAANLVAALNNRAILQVRKRQYLTAIGLWRQALEIAPMTPELVQNLGLMVELANTAQYVRISRQIKTAASNLYSKYAVDNSLNFFDKQVGWLFIPYVDTADGSVDATGDEEFVNVAWATGFCVGGEYLLTSRYPFDDCDRVMTREGGNSFASAEGKVVAVEPGSHLAVVRINGLEGKPLPLSLIRPKPAQDVTIIGYGSPGLMANTFQHRSATILDPPRFFENITLVVRQNQGGSNVFTRTNAVRETQTLEHTVGAPGTDVFTRTYDVRRLMVHDAVTNAAMEGAPLITGDGKVVGVHLGNRSQFGEMGSKNSWAESIEFVINRLRGIVDGIDFSTKSGSDAKELDKDEIETLANGAIYQLAAQKRFTRLSWSHRIEETHRLQQQGGWTSYEDTTCMACNGKLRMKCLDCTRGVVKRHERELKHRDANTGVEIWGTKTTKHACTTCGGNGYVPCTNCEGTGIDGIFTQKHTQPVGRNRILDR